MKKPETLFKEKIAKKLKEKGVWFYKTNDKTARGIPDFIICANGKFIAIELKVGDNKPTKLQEYQLNSIRQAKGVALVIYPETQDDLLKNL